MRFYKIIPLLVLSILPALSFSQKEEIDTVALRRIKEEGLQRSQVMEIARNITDVTGARLTNSPGYFRAANWIVSTLKGWGVTAPRLEAWGKFGLGWQVKKSYCAMTAPYYSQLIAYPVPWSGSTPGPVSAPVYLLEKLDSAYLVAHAGEIKGKIVLVRSFDTVVSSVAKPINVRRSDSSLQHMQSEDMIASEDISPFFNYLRKIQRLETQLMKLQAVCLLKIPYEEITGPVAVDGFWGYKKSEQPAYPKLILQREAFLRIQRLLEHGQPVRLDLDIKSEFIDADVNGYNVVAEIPGSDPALRPELVMLGGHLDSWQSATGATDNGAGSAAALEAIRIIQTLDLKPARTIRIALWSGEEQGLLGSYNYVKNHFGAPEDMVLKPEQALVSAYYNLDNGSGRIRGVFTQGNEAVVPIFSQWLKAYGDESAQTVTAEKTGETDHESFDAVGIPGFQFIQDWLDYETRTHHTNVDTYDHLNAADLKQASTLMAAFVYLTAMRKEKLPRKPLPKPSPFPYSPFF